MNRHDTHVSQPFAGENSFRKKYRSHKPLPRYTEAKHRLPEPFWEGHDAALRCYWKTWELAFENLRQPQEDTRFVSDFIDTAFNGNLFMWDSVFILMFAKYASPVFNFQQTLDNFYAHQHRDGFICREIREEDSAEMFDRFDPSSTGPNILAWSEWEYFKITRDKERLERVFPVLMAYNHWYRKHRTWQDGSYWSSGWGCGMDNQPRVGDGYSREFDHGHNSWIDITLQQIFNDRILIDMAHALGRDGEADHEAAEMIRLTGLVNGSMWDGESHFYYDKDRKGRLSDIKSIGAYWALLADVVPPENREAFIGHLTNKEEFGTLHPLPSLSVDDERYNRRGGSWLGGVWAPTNYMVLKGLSLSGYHDLAHRIGLTHNQFVTEVYEKTGTLWENYAPESMAPGNHAKPDFVGWTGLSSVAVLFEYVFGIRAVPEKRRLEWRINLTEEHGVRNFCFGKCGINLLCPERDSPADEPDVRVVSDHPVDVEIIWPGGSRMISS